MCQLYRKYREGYLMMMHPTGSTLRNRGRSQTNRFASSKKRQPTNNLCADREGCAVFENNLFEAAIFSVLMGWITTISTYCLDFNFHQLLQVGVIH